MFSEAVDSFLNDISCGVLLSSGGVEATSARRRGI